MHSVRANAYAASVSKKVNIDNVRDIGNGAFRIFQEGGKGNFTDIYQN